MIEIDTLILIDLYNSYTLPKQKDKNQHREVYHQLSRDLEQIILNTGVTDVVYAAYGSLNELSPENTDNIFRDKTIFPLDKIKRHVLYKIDDDIDLFKDKNILLAGTSFYTCIRTRPLGIRALLDSGLPKGVWSSPNITCYYGKPREAMDQVVENSEGPVHLKRTSEKDYRQDENFKWRLAELTDFHNIFRCNYINSTK